MCNSHHDTKHPVKASRGTRDCATGLTAGKYHDQVPTGDETQRRHYHATELGLHGMGYGGRESTPRGDRHRLEGLGGMGG